MCFLDILEKRAIIYFGAQINFNAVPVIIHCTDTQRQSRETCGKEAIHDKVRDNV